MKKMHGRRGSKPPKRAVKRPVRPCKSATQNRFTVGNAKGALATRAGAARTDDQREVIVEPAWPRVAKSVVRQPPGPYLSYGESLKEIYRVVFKWLQHRWLSSPAQISSAAVAIASPSAGASLPCLTLYSATHFFSVPTRGRWSHYM